MREVWLSVLDFFKNAYSEEIFDPWFGKLEYIEDEDPDVINIRVPSVPHSKFIRSQFEEAIEQKASEIAGRAVKIKYTIKDPNEDIVLAQVNEKPDQRKEKELPVPRSIDEIASKCGLHPGLTFDTFVIGNANRVARSSAMLVADFPGEKCNPLFIYGGVGLGKTHLMHAVGRKILEDNPRTNLLCISANRFINEVVSLSAGGKFSDEKIQNFDNKYRNLDALLIDDVQFLCKRGGSQQRLFNIFEALLPKNKQIILTCDTYARQLSDFDERLISRFGAGLSVSIEPAEFELRAAILLQKAKQQGIELPLEVAYLIATRLNTNIRELEGALNSVIMRSEVFKKPITEDLAKEALQGITGTGRISIENIQQTTAEHFNIKIADMHSKRRVANVAYARQIAMYLAKELTQKSLIDIGNAFGGRDHATVLYAVKKITKERAQNQELNHTLHLIEQDLKNWN